MKDYLADFLTEPPKKQGKPIGGQYQKAQKVSEKAGVPMPGAGSKGTKGTFDTFDTATPKRTPGILPNAEENIEMHDSALFDVIVDVDFYDGRRIRIPQEVWPDRWEAPF